MRWLQHSQTLPVRTSMVGQGLELFPGDQSLLKMKKTFDGWRVHASKNRVLRVRASEASTVIDFGGAWLACCFWRGKFPSKHGTASSQPGEMHIEPTAIFSQEEIEVFVLGHSLSVPASIVVCAVCDP